MKGLFERKNNFDLIAFITDDFEAFPPLFHPHCELVFVIEGEMKVTVDGVERNIKSGEGAFVFSYVTHSYFGAKGVKAACLLFDPRLTYFSAVLYENKPKDPFIKNVLPYIPTIKRICELNHSKNKDVIKGAHGYLNGVIAEILSSLELEKNEQIENDISKRVLEYCSEHFTEKITVRSVSEALFISQSYVSKVFSKKLCYSFREYINILRIDKAKHLLDSTNEKILDVMLDVGFNNQSSFNRVFLDIVGLSPKEYRKREK